MHKLKWVRNPQTMLTHGVKTQSAGTYAAFEFTDVTSGLKATSPAVYCELEWHFVMAGPASSASFHAPPH